MTISISSVPTNTLVPGAYVEINTARVLQALGPIPESMLLLAQKLAAGSASANVPVLVDKGNAETLLGKGSVAANMALIMAKVNPYLPLWCIPQADPSGATATGTITLGGSPTVSGSLYVMIAGRRYPVPVATTDTPTTLTAALTALVNADLSAMVSAVNTCSTIVTINAKQNGTYGNGIDIRVNYDDGNSTPSGLTVSIAAMSSGSGDPTVTAAITAMGDVQYKWIASQYNDTTAIGALETELARRYGPLVQSDGIVFYAKQDTVTNLGIYGVARNSPFGTCAGVTSLPSHVAELAANYCAVAAYELNLDPNRTIKTVELTEIVPPARANRYIFSEANVLLGKGITTLMVNAGGKLAIQRAVTTYQKNVAGAPDKSLRDLEKVTGAMAVRWYYATGFMLMYPRHKFARNATIPPAGQAIARPKDIEAWAIGLARRLEQEKGLLMNVETNKTGIKCEPDSSEETRANLILPTDIMPALHVLAAQVQLS